MAARKSNGKRKKKPTATGGVTKAKSRKKTSPRNRVAVAHHIPRMSQRLSLKRSIAETIASDGDGTMSQQATQKRRITKPRVKIELAPVVVDVLTTGNTSMTLADSGSNAKIQKVEASDCKDAIVCKNFLPLYQQIKKEDEDLSEKLLMCLKSTDPKQSNNRDQVRDETDQLIVANSFLMKFVRPDKEILSMADPVQYFMRNSVMERTQVFDQASQIKDCIEKVATENSLMKGFVGTFTAVDKEKDNLISGLRVENQRLQCMLQEERSRFCLDWRNRDAERLVEETKKSAEEQNYYLQEKVHSTIDNLKSQYENQLKELDEDRKKLAAENESVHNRNERQKSRLDELKKEHGVCLKSRKLSSKVHSIMQWMSTRLAKDLQKSDQTTRTGFEFQYGDFTNSLVQSSFANIADKTEFQLSSAEERKLQILYERMKLKVKQKLKPSDIKDFIRNLDNDADKEYMSDAEIIHTECAELYEEENRLAAWKGHSNSTETLSTSTPCLTLVDHGKVDRSSDGIQDVGVISEIEDEDDDDESPSTARTLKLHSTDSTTIENVQLESAEIDNDNTEQDDTENLAKTLNPYQNTECIDSIEVYEEKDNKLAIWTFHANSTETLSTSTPGTPCLALVDHGNVDRDRSDGNQDVGVISETVDDHDESPSTERTLKIHSTDFTTMENLHLESVDNDYKEQNDAVNLEKTLNPYQIVDSSTEEPNNTMQFHLTSMNDWEMDTHLNTGETGHLLQDLNLSESDDDPSSDAGLTVDNESEQGGSSEYDKEEIIKQAIELGLMPAQPEQPNSAGDDLPESSHGNCYEVPSRQVVEDEAMTITISSILPPKVPDDRLVAEGRRVEVDGSESQLQPMPRHQKIPDLPYFSMRGQDVPAAKTKNCRPIAEKSVHTSSPQMSVKSRLSSSCRKIIPVNQTSNLCQKLRFEETAKSSTKKKLAQQLARLGESKQSSNAPVSSSSGEDVKVISDKSDNACSDDTRRSKVDLPVAHESEIRSTSSSYGKVRIARTKSTPYSAKNLSSNALVLPSANAVTSKQAKGLRQLLKLRRGSGKAAKPCKRISTSTANSLAASPVVVSQQISKQQAIPSEQYQHALMQNVLPRLPTVSNEPSQSLPDLVQMVTLNVLNSMRQFFPNNTNIQMPLGVPFPFADIPVASNPTNSNQQSTENTVLGVNSTESQFPQELRGITNLENGTEYHDTYDSPMSPSTTVDEGQLMGVVDQNTQLFSNKEWKFVDLAVSCPVQFWCSRFLSELIEECDRDVLNGEFEKICAKYVNQLMTMERKTSANVYMVLASHIYDFVRTSNPADIDDWKNPVKDDYIKLAMIIRKLSAKTMGGFDFSKLPELMFEYFGTQVLPHRLKNFGNEDLTLNKLGRFYSHLGKEFHLQTQAINLLLQAVYYRPHQAFSLAVAMFKIDLPFAPSSNFDELSLKLKCILFCLLAPQRFKDARGYVKLRGFISSVQFKAPQQPYKEFVTSVIDEFKLLESSAAQMDASKCVGALLMQVAPEENIQFIGELMTSVTTEWRSGQINDGAFAQFITTIGQVFENTADSVKGACLQKMQTIFESLINGTNDSKIVNDAVRETLSRVTKRLQTKGNWTWNWVYTRNYHHTGNPGAGTNNNKQKKKKFRKLRKSPSCSSATPQSTPQERPH